MGKTLSCRDVGVDCDYVARAETEEEILAMCGAHAKEDHGMESVTEDMLEKVRAAIKDE